MVNYFLQKLYHLYSHYNVWKHLSCCHLTGIEYCCCQFYRPKNGITLFQFALFWLQERLNIFQMFIRHLCFLLRIICPLLVFLFLWTSILKLVKSKTIAQLKTIWNSFLKMRFPTLPRVPSFFKTNVWIPTSRSG